MHGVVILLVTTTQQASHKAAGMINIQIMDIERTEKAVIFKKKNKMQFSNSCKHPLKTNNLTVH